MVSLILDDTYSVARMYKRNALLQGVFQASDGRLYVYVVRSTINTPAGERGICLDDNLQVHAKTYEALKWPVTYLDVLEGRVWKKDGSDVPLTHRAPICRSTRYPR
jgi:hypothetical protein